MRIKNVITQSLTAVMLLSLIACNSHVSVSPSAEKSVITDMIGREVAVIPGSYKRVVCIGASALRMYSYIGDVTALCGVEDIDNTALEERPKMFDGIARPYLIAYEEVFSKLPSCGVGGPGAQVAEAEKILSCNPDIVISGYEDTVKANALQTQLGIPVVTLRTGAQGVFDEAFVDSVALLGVVFGKETRAKEIGDFVASERAEIYDRTKNIPDTEKPDVYICGLGNRGTTNHLMTTQNYISFTVANVRNVLTDLPSAGITPIEREKFISIGKDIDIVFIDNAAINNIKDIYKTDNTIFDSCKAWQTGQVYTQLPYNVYYTNYEIALINTWFIAGTVYPEAFTDIDIKEKANEIIEFFLGQMSGDKLLACQESNGGCGKVDVGTF